MVPINPFNGGGAGISVSGNEAIRDASLDHPCNGRVFQRVGRCLYPGSFGGLPKGFFYIGHGLAVILQHIIRGCHFFGLHQGVKEAGGLLAAFSSGEEVIFRLQGMAMAAGGILLALVWLPGRVSRGQFVRFLPALVTVGALACGVVFVAFPDVLFSFANMPGKNGAVAGSLGPLGFLAAAAYFSTRLNRRREGEGLVFASFSLLFAISGFFSAASLPWEASWWFLHGLRMGAVLLVLFYVMDRHFTVAARLMAADTSVALSSHERGADELYLASTVLEYTNEAIAVTDAENNIVMVNPAFTQITGYSEDEVKGRNPSMLSSGKQDTAFYDAMWKSIDETGRWQGEIWNRRKSGEVYPEWLSIIAPKDELGQIRRHIAIFSDISQHKGENDPILQQANFDPLTGLPNRTLFKDRLERELAKGHREGTLFALLFLDLDHFKEVNDTLGHSAGDQLLREVSERLGYCVRESDTLGRRGGDEFMVILSDIQDILNAELVATKILTELVQPFVLEGTEAFISGSIGITLFPFDGEDAETLLKNADTAMYQAKEDGRNAFRFFTPEMNAQAMEHLSMEGKLRKAMEANAFSLVYQPIINIGNGEVAGMEALLRWSQDDGKAVSPSEFIPLAEETGLIVPLGKKVVESVCEQAKPWQEEGLPPIRVTVNISSRQCRDPDFKDMVVEAMTAAGVDPTSLTLEITESLFLQSHMESAIKALHDLRKEGLFISLDDFGTGYSSLNVLKSFPVDVLKIDRSFISDLSASLQDMALVEAVLAMAHSLSIAVVAEGVETEEQLAYLRDQNCDFAQGYIYGRPIPAEECAPFIRSRMAEMDGTAPVK